MKRCLFVVNPISGGVEKEGFLNRLKDWCAVQRLEYDVLQTQGQDDQARIQERCRSFGPEVVVACGGDGTINLVGRSILGKDISLGIVPLGSANGLATELNIPSKLEDALSIILSGDKQPFDVLCINDKHYCFHLCDMGFNATIVDNFERSNLRGQFAYLLFFIKSLFHNYVRRYHFRFPDKEYDLWAAMVVIANGRSYGMGAEVNPKGRPGDGRFEVCTFKKYPWYAFFGMLFRFLTGKLRSSRYYRVRSTEWVQVTSHRPVELQVDGEALGHFREMRATVLPHSLSILVPNSEQLLHASNKYIELLQIYT